MLASVALSDTMIKTAANQWRLEYGYSDIVVKPSLSSPSRYFSQFKADLQEDLFAYTVKKLSAGGRISGDTFILHGYTLETLLLMHELPFTEQLNLFPFAGNKIILSAGYAAQHHIEPGDALTVDINGNKHHFIVAGICPQIGPFAYEKDTFTAIIPFEKMQACLGQLGKADTLYIGLRDQTAKSRMILRLSELYRGYSVGETYSMEHIRLQTNRSAVPFIFMSVLLCLMAVYVIYVIFQNIVIERMPQMGIFRAIGAGKTAADAVVFLEGTAYGVAGGLLSLGAGVLLLAAMAWNLKKGEGPGAISLSVSPWHITLTLLTCVGISIAGGFISLRKYKAMSIVGLIRQSAGEKARSRAVLPWLAAALFLVCMAILTMWRSQNGLILYVLLVIAIMLSFMMTSPLLYQRFAVLIKRIMAGIRGVLRVVSLSVQNQRGFVVAATILAVITATNIIIGTITYSSEQGNRLYFDRFQYEIELAAGDLTRGKINLVEQLPGVKSVCANYYSSNIEVQGKGISIYRIHGVDTLRAEAFMDYDVTSSHALPFEALENGKNILLTQTLRNIYNVHENDTIILKIFAYDGVYREVPYQIIGFFDDEFTKLGRYALISHRNFAEDFKARTYSSFYIAADDVEKALGGIAAAYRDRQFQLTTVREMQDALKEESRLIISAMGWISYLSAITGVLGMLFIMLLSFQNRQGEFSIYSAMGFEKSGVGKMLFAEMWFAGLGGLAAGIAMGSVISFIALPKLIYALQIALSIQFSPAVLTNACLFGFGICIVSGVFGVFSFRRTTVMGGLRCEL